MCKRFSSSHCRFRLLGWSCCESLYSSFIQSLLLSFYINLGLKRYKATLIWLKTLYWSWRRDPLGHTIVGGREREKAVFGKWEIFLQLVENGDVESSIFCDGNLCPCYLSASPLHQCSNPCTYPCPYK